MNEELRTLVDRAIAELTLMPTSTIGGAETPAHERTVAVTLQAIDGQLGPRGSTMLFEIGNNIVRAVTLLEMVREAMVGPKL